MNDETAQMESNQELDQPVTNANNQSNPFKIATIILSVVVLGLIIFLAYLLLNKEKVTEAVIDQPNTQAMESISNLPPETTISNLPVETTNNRYSLGGVVSFDIPEPWEITSDPLGFDKGCPTVTVVTPPEAINCIAAVGLIPGVRFSQFDGSLVQEGQEHFMVNIGVRSDPRSLEEIIEEPTGLYTNDMTDSRASINGYQAYYRRISNNSYTDIWYLIRSNSSDAVVAIYARVLSRHYTPGGQSVDNEADFTRFEPAIKQIAHSVKFN